MADQPSNTPPSEDPMVRRMRELAEEAEKNAQIARKTRDELEKARKKQDEKLADAEKLAQAGKEVDLKKEEVALDATKLMLSEQPDEVKSFLENAERQVRRYERFEVARDTAFAKLPQTAENKKNMESIVKKVTDSYIKFHEHYSAIPTPPEDPWKLNTDQKYAEHWKNMMEGTNELERSLDEYDALTVDYAATAQAGTRQAASPNEAAKTPSLESLDVIPVADGGVLVSESGGIATYFIPSRHPAFKEAVNRGDLRPLTVDLDAIGLTESDWEKVGGGQDGSWRKADVQPVAEAVARRMDNPEPPAPLERPAPQVTETPKQEAVPAQQPLPASVEPPKKEEAPQPAVAEQKPEPKKIDVPEENKPDAVVPPQKVEQPAVAEKVPEGIRAVLKEDGSIEVATQETIYIAYYLPNGERQRNYVRFPATDVSRWSIDGMCVAERTADGWTVHPEAGLPGTFPFNVAGRTTIVTPPRDRTKPGFAQTSALKEADIDPEFPTLSRILAESASK